MTTHDANPGGPSGLTDSIPAPPQAAKPELDARELSVSTAPPDVEPRPASRVKGRHGWPIVRAILFLAVLGAATFGLSKLTHGVATWVLAILLTLLWLAGITWFVNAVRGRRSLVTQAVQPAVVAERKVLAQTWRRASSQAVRRAGTTLASPPGHPAEPADVDIAGLLRQHNEELRKYNEENARLRREQNEALAQIRALLFEPTWKRISKAVLGIVAGAALGWFLGYELPAPPPATAVTSPANTTSPQPGPSNS